MNWDPITIVLLICIGIPVIGLAAGVIKDLRRGIRIDITPAEQIRKAQESSKAAQFAKCSGTKCGGKRFPVSKLHRGYCIDCVPTAHIPKARVGLPKPEIRVAILKEDV